MSDLDSSTFHTMDDRHTSFNGSSLVVQHGNSTSDYLSDSNSVKQACVSEENVDIYLVQVEFWMPEIATSIMIIVVTFVGIPGNVLNALVFYRLGLREKINLCLFSLAVINIIYLLAKLLGNAEFLYGQTIEPLWAIQPYTTCASGIGYASQFLSAVIASERCFCVVSPFHAKRLLKTSTMAAIIVVCSVLLTGGMCAIAGPNHRASCMLHLDTKVIEVIECVTEYYLQNRRIMDIFDIYVYATALSGIFLLVTVVTTVITAVKVRAAIAWRLTTLKTTTAATTTQSDADERLSSKEVSMTLMLMASSILFTVCITATLVIQICRVTVPDFNYEGLYVTLIGAAWKVVFLFWSLNSSLNILVYYKMGSKFREEVMAMVGLKK